MAHSGFLACGPGGPLLLLLGGMALGSLVLVMSFLIGFLCLFTSKWKLGIWLTAVPAAIFAAVYALLQQQTLLP